MREILHFGPDNPNLSVDLPLLMVLLNISNLSGDLPIMMAFIAVSVRQVCYLFISQVIFFSLVLFVIKFRAVVGFAMGLVNFYRVQKILGDCGLSFYSKRYINSPSENRFTQRLIVPDNVL